MDLNEKEIAWLRKGISRCSTCAITKRKLKCPNHKTNGFCFYEIEKLKGIEDFETLQKQIVISFGELLVLLAERTKVRSSFGSITTKEMQEVGNMLAKWITGTRTRGKLTFQKKDFSKVLSEDDVDKDK